MPIEVVVVLDDCRDGTHEVIPAGVRSVVVPYRCVGRARAAGFLGAPDGDDWWLATTDADTLVPPDWCQEQLRVAQVADVFVGTVTVGDWSERPPALQGR